MKKKIIFISLAFLMLGTISYFYINNIFLPVRVKATAEEALSKQFGRPVTIDRLRYDLFKGFKLTNILVKENEENTKALLRIDEASFNILIASFIKEKTIILPSVRIKKPYIYLARLNDGQWNISSLWSTEKSDSSSSYTPYIRKIIIEDGAIDYNDYTKEKSFSETFRHINLKTTINIDTTVDFSFTTQIPIENTDLSMKGRFTPKSKELQAQVETQNLNLVKYFSLVNPNEHIQMHDGILHTSSFDLTYASKKFTIDGMMHSNNIDIGLGVNKRVKGNIRLNDFTLSSQEKMIKASGELLIPSAKLILDSKKEIYGDIRADLKNVFLQEKKASLEGDIWIDHMKLNINDIAQVQGNIKALKTNFSYTHDDIQTQTQMTIENGSIIYNKTHQASLTSFSRDLKLSWKDNQLKVDGDFKLDNPSYRFPQGTFQSAHLKTDKLVLEAGSDKLILKSLFESRESSFNLHTGFSFADDPKIDITYKYDPKAEEHHQLSGSFLFKKGHLKNLPQIQEAMGLKGRLSFNNTNLESKDLQFQTLNTDWQLAGELILGEKPVAHAVITTEKLFIEELNPVLGEALKKFDLVMSGPTALSLKYQGELNKDAEAKIQLTANLKDVTAFHPKIQVPFSHLSGKIYYEKDLVQWNNLKGIWLDEKITINGNIKNFTRPVLTNVIDSPKLHVESQANILKNLIQITTFKGNVFSSEFDLSGDVFFKEDGTHVFLKGESFMDTKDLPRLLPQYKETWNDLKLDGVLKSDVTFRGHPKYWHDWSLNIEASAPVLRVKGLEFENFQAHYGQRDRTISDANIKANLYNGKLYLTSNADLSAEDIILKGNVELFDLDLKDYSLKNELRKKLKGKVSLKANIEGPILEPSLLKGKGNMTITDGSLYHLNIIEGLSSVALIPEFKNAVFTEARADFIIKDQKFQSSNTIMKSPTINLIGKGWIGFNGKINYDVVPEFSEIALIQSESLRKGPTALLTHTVKIKITGSVKKPRYNVDSAPLNIIKDAPAMLREGVGAILGEIF